MLQVLTTIFVYTYWSSIGLGVTGAVFLYKTLPSDQSFYDHLLKEQNPLAKYCFAGIIDATYKPTFKSYVVFKNVEIFHENKVQCWFGIANNWFGK